MREIFRNPVLALFLGIIALTILPSLGQFSGLLFGVFFIIALAIWASRSSSQRSSSEWEEREEYVPRQQRTRERSGSQERSAVQPVAVDAMRRAGQNPSTLTVAPVDVGMLVYEQQGNPVVYREERLPETAEYLRPYAVLHSPRRARGKIRFELTDESGTRRFVDVTDWELKAGETFVYPQNWLPTRNLETIDGQWALRLYAAGVLLGVHEFRWRELGGGEVRAILTGDAEIKGDVLKEIKRRNERLSLDDLLSDQEGGLIEEDPEAEAAEREAERLNRQRARRR